MTTFRVHFTDGSSVDIAAKSTTEARDAARHRKGGGIITKVKRVKEERK